MRYRRIDRTFYVASTTYRFRANVFMGLGPEHPGKQKYWARTAFSAADSGALLKLCADHGDTFALRSWMRIIKAQKRIRKNACRFTK